MHIKRFFVLLTLFQPIWIIAQINTDSLYNEYLWIHNYSRGNIKTERTLSVHPDNKCGFGISNQIRQNFGLFTSEQQSILSTLMDRTSDLQTSIASPSGIFRIHFDTTGTRAPKYFNLPGKSVSEIARISVDSLAAAFEKSYDYEVNYLGYPPPVTDNGKGGDDLYDIYIINFNNYGQTDSDAGSNSSYIHIENDFVGTFATHDIVAAKATAAHEFHHAIQLAHYGFYSTETTFYELTSTAMEEFVFDETNDYYGYLQQYFNRPYYSFLDFTGYQLGIFYLYLYQKYLAEDNDGMKAHKIIKRTWEILAQNHKAIEALSDALEENGTSLKTEWNTFGLWCYFTGSRTKPGEYFEEAKNYPLMQPTASYDYQPPMKEYVLNTNPISNSYLFFEVRSDEIIDTLVTVITNADIDDGKTSPFQRTEVKYSLATAPESGFTKVVNEYYSKMETASPDLFKEGNIFRNTIVSGGDISSEAPDFAYPQPFIYDKHSTLRIPAEPNTLEYADLNIYTTSMNLVYSGRKNISIGEKIIVSWDVLDDSGNRLPTGIYIYVTRSGDKIKKGKFVVYNE